MKVLIITGEFPNMVGGVSDYTHNLAIALSKKGIKLYILTSKNIHVLKDFNPNIEILAVVKNWGITGLADIVRIINDINPQWVVLQFVPFLYQKHGLSFAISALILYCRLRRYKIITNFHEIGLRLSINSPCHLVLALAHRVISYAIACTSDLIITSNQFYGQILTLFKKKTHVVPIGSSIRRREIDEDARQKIRQKIAPRGQVIISAFGTNAPQRNYSIILEAVAKYANLNLTPHLRIILIGNFQNTNTLKTICKKNGIEDLVLFTGYLSEEEVFNYLTSSDAFILLDIWQKKGEGGASTKSTSLASAYAAALPIISNKGDMTESFFKHGENIFFIETVDQEGIVRALHTLLNDRKLINKLRVGASTLYNQYLDWDVIADKYMKLMHKNIKD